MLFDEPKFALDLEMVRKVLDVIIGLADSWMTMVCVTHKVGFVCEVAEWVMLPIYDSPTTDRGEMAQSR